MEIQRGLMSNTLPETFPGRMSASEIAQDLKNCLNPEKELIKGSELQQVIVYYAEQTVEPVGWQALWMSDSKTSSSLKMRLRSPVMVEVIKE